MKNNYTITIKPMREESGEYFRVHKKTENDYHDTKRCETIDEAIEILRSMMEVDDGK